MVFEFVVIYECFFSEFFQLFHAHHSPIFPKLIHIYINYYYSSCLRSIFFFFKNKRTFSKLSCDCNLMRCVSYALNFGSASSINENGTRLWETLIFPTYMTSKNCELFGEMSGMVKFVVLLPVDEFPLLFMLKLLLLSV